MNIKSRIDRIPGGMMIIPLFLGACLNTFAPGTGKFFGSFTNGLITGTLPILSVWFFCIGASISLKATPLVLRKSGVLVSVKIITAAIAGVIDFTEADWDLVMNINIKSVFFLCQAFGRYAIGHGRWGKIINIASMLSFQGGIRVPSYTASKSGVAGITRLLACEWAGKGINVNAIAPGYVATNNTAALRADETRNAEILGRIPAGRWSVSADIGGPAVFLASEAADYIHGAVLPVDGGWLAR